MYSSSRIENKYQFKYKSKKHYIDLNTLLTSQLHFNKSVQEVKQYLYPNLNLNIKVEAFKEGSFDVNQVYEIATVSALFTLQNFDYVSQIFSVLSDYISIKEFLKGSKATQEIVKGDKVELRVNGNNNFIIVDSNALKLFKNSSILHDALCEQAKVLEADKNIDGFQVTDLNKKQKRVNVDRNDFPLLESKNPYLDQDNKELTKHAILGIYKWETSPKKGSKWSFIYEGRKINQVLIKAEDFIRDVVEKKYRFGAGDCLEADVLIKYKRDESTGMFLEAKYEILKVYRIIWRNEQQSLF